MKRLIVGISGASGAIYGIRLLETLKAIGEVETHLIMSRYGRLNIEIETSHSPRDVEALADVVHSVGNQAAAISSGSFKTDGMVIAPCSMKTLSAVVHSAADSLLARAADVVLKEQRRLVLMPREAPLHAGHCKLLYDAANLGAVETVAGTPATTSHVECTPEERAALGIPEGLVRYSVGIEDPEDLVADLAAALAAAREAGA